MATMLTTGYYFKKYETPFNEAPIGPFKNEQEARAAAGGKKVEDAEYYALIHVPFHNFAWGNGD